ncbi:hypothetical protein CK203_050032 [Vitis vinifera]|uniref:Uncharacterized protein n=1 Tax=Vitis vinifera TaxID=29760 RepID=A0A438H4Y7_VITVI|nr:hypothetical protein CK203_050032 [Vitis vinifera]
MTFNIPLFFIYTGHLSCEKVSKGGNAIAVNCSSPCPSPTTCEPPIIFSGHRFRPNFDSPIWREPDEPNLPLLPAANESREEHLFKAPLLNLSGQKLFPLRRSPCLKILRRGVISLEPSPPPSRRLRPPAEPQEHQPPLSEPQIPSGIAPEPPSNCGRSLQIHSAYCVDIMEHLLAPRDFFYPRVAMDFYQSMTTKQHWTQRRGVLLALFKISEGYFFGPHHLIMAALLYFEEKILEHLGYPSDPQLERKRISERYLLSTSGNMTAYRVEQPGRPQPAEIPAARRASPRHIPEGIPIASPTISRAPPVTPASSEPSTSAEPRMAIPISEYRELCRSLQTLTASQKPCSGDGSYSSMPGADVDHPGSAHCHLEAAPASSRSSISC